MPPTTSIAQQQRPPTPLPPQPPSPPPSPPSPALRPMVPKISFTGMPLPPAEARIPHEETTIIFDWDDTCLASHYLAINGFNTRGICFPLKREFAEMGDILASVVGPLLLHAAHFGRVVIVTNGTDGWVQMSCERFMPSLMPLISQLTVISAQDRYRDIIPTRPIEWKRRTFRDVLDAETRPLGRVRNLISIGDGIAEQMAMHAMKGYPDTLFINPVNLVKTVKLMEFPTLESLVMQLKLVHELLEGIVHYPASLDTTARLEFVLDLPPLPDSESESDAPEAAPEPPRELDIGAEMEDEWHIFFRDLVDATSPFA
jgi:hypothetical protein